MKMSGGCEDGEAVGCARGGEGGEDERGGEDVTIENGARAVAGVQ